MTATSDATDRLRRVAIYRARPDASYPTAPPYHPSEAYPEYPFGSLRSPAPNPAYEAVRGALLWMGLDARRFGTRDWNPLADLLGPNDRVVIKPNMVRDFHESPEEGTVALITHGSIVRAIIDFVFLAKGGRGEVVVCDSPQNDADWDGLWRAFAFDELLAFYREHAPGFAVHVHDIRTEAVRKRHGVVVRRYQRPGDPRGYARIDLGERSEFAAVPERTGRLYGAEYDISQTETHHRPGRHEYLVGKSFLEADVIINVPKIKTHKKSGITVWLKSVIGICGDKNWLPHHTEGTPASGGDQFAADSVKTRTEQRLVAMTRAVVRRTGPIGAYGASALRKMGTRVFGDTNRNAIRSGNWHGNDTIWRTVLDLHKCWIYADADGRLHATPQRRFLCLADGVVAGEGNGPLAPTAKRCGVVVAGLDPVAVDTACAVLMGFDPDRLRILKGAARAGGLALGRVAPADIRCVSNHAAWNGPVDGITDTLDFAPHFGWVGHLERPGARRG
jgi:uncharacterized protein (DUF362 family)